MKTKPCPHCGSEDVINQKKPIKARNPITLKVLAKHYAVWCSDCGAYGPHGDTRKEALELWNKRK